MTPRTECSPPRRTVPGSLRTRRLRLAFALALGVAVAACGSATDEELTVYSARQDHLIEPIFERFTDETGIRVRYVTDNAGPLMERLRAEGERTPADLLLTVDAGNLYQAADADLLQPFDSELLRTRIPEHLRDPEDRWFGFSVRARPILYHPDRVDPAELGRYEDLADADWAGRLCLRTSQKVYNQSLVAMMISHDGEEQTRAVVEGWVDNLATSPFSSDTAVIEAIEAGQCDVGIANTYYLGRLLRDDPDYPVKIFWPNQGDRGTHVNISGAGITRYSDNPEAAQALLEWLASDGAQELFAGLNLEYPAVEGVPPDEIVQAWGEFEADTINVSEAGRLQRQAAMLMDRAGYR